MRGRRRRSSRHPRGGARSHRPWRSIPSCRRRRRGRHGAGTPARAENARATFARRSARGRSRWRRMPGRRSSSGAQGNRPGVRKLPRQSSTAGAWPLDSPRSRSAGTNVSTSAAGAARATRRSGRLLPARGHAVLALSRRRRTRAHHLRRRARRGRSRRRASVQCTRRNGEPARAPEPHTDRTRAGRSERAVPGSTADRLADAAAHTAAPRQQDVDQAHPTDGRGARPVAGTVPESCRDYSAADGTARSSRRSGRISTRSAGSLTGRKRPRGPWRGTTRNVVGTWAESSW